MAVNNEDYFQITSDILASFPRFRPPLDLYVLQENITVLQPYCRKGKRLSEEQVQELQQLCKNGNIFVAYSDQAIYKKHILKQIDLVLLDPHFTEGEIAELCIEVAVQRYKDYYEQPVAEVLELLFRDVMVITEYLWADKYRITAFMRRLFRQWKPARHAVNTMIVGTWIWLQVHTNFTRKELDRTMIALILHDVGMSKIPEFMLTKTVHLSMDEVNRIHEHTLQSVRMLQKSDLKFDELIRACFEHHERLDGSGYPQHSKDNMISSMGRLTAVADSFSAMITNRCYAKAKDFEVAANELYEDPRYDKKYTSYLTAAFVAGGALSEHCDMDSILEAAIKD